MRHSLGLLPLLVALSGCTSSGVIGGSVFPDSPTRHAESRVWVVADGELTNFGFNSASGATPLEIGFWPVPTFKGGDNQRKVDYLSKVELDFGEGAGWQDFTQDFRDNYAYRANYDVNHMIRHIYSEPGEYRIFIRATYWDGEVVVCDQTTPSGMPQPVRITVLPASP